MTDAANDTDQRILIYQQMSRTFRISSLFRANNLFFSLLHAGGDQGTGSGATGMKFTGGKISRAYKQDDGT